MVVKELEECFAPQLPVDRHEVETAEVSRFSRFDGLLPSQLFSFQGTREDVFPALVHDDIFVSVNFDSPIVPGNRELAVGPELFGHYDCIHFLKFICPFIRDILAGDSFVFENEFNYVQSIEAVVLLEYLGYVVKYFFCHFFFLLGT